MNPPYIHPAAMAETGALGEGTRVWAFSHVQQGASVGARCNIGEHCFIEAGAVIGDCVTVKNGNHIWDGVTLEDGVFIGPGVCFTNDLWPRSPRLRQAGKRYATHQWLTPTLVQHGASIGAGAIIIAGNTIGRFATVGAGAVVTHPVPDHALVTGAPARVAGWLCECGRRLQITGTKAGCRYCGLPFTCEIRKAKVVGVSAARTFTAGSANE